MRVDCRESLSLPSGPSSLALSYAFTTVSSRHAHLFACQLDWNAGCVVRSQHFLIDRL